MTFEYPYRPPRLKAKNFIFHPNIDTMGNVCLSLIWEDWTPAYTLVDIIEALTTIFYSPGLEDPLNKEAADEYLKGRVSFQLKKYELMEDKKN